MYKNVFLRKRMVALTIMLSLVLTFSAMLSAYAYANDNTSISEKINDTVIIQLAAIGGFNQYFPNCPYQENSLIVTQFTGSKLTLAAAATVGSLGHADYVIIRIKQRDAFGLMKTIYSGTVYTDGVAKTIVSSGSIIPYADLQITADVRSYNGTTCTANVSISASSSN